MSSNMPSPPEASNTEKDLIHLLENELKTSDDRYLKIRTKLLQTLTSNAKLLEYIQYTEDQLSFYKQKAILSDKKTTINSYQHKLPLDVDFNDNKQNQTPNHLQTHEKVGLLLSHTNGLEIESFLPSICSLLSFDAASIYSISHSLEKIQCELSTLTHMNNKHSYLLNEGFLSQIIKHKKRIIIKDVNNTNFKFNMKRDDRFVGLDDERKTFTVCLEPLFDNEENKEMIGILELINCSNKDEEYENNTFKSTLQITTNIISNLLSNILIKREYKNSNIHKEALLELAKVMSNNNSSNKNNIENLIENVRKTVYKSVKCDKVALFMVDEIRHELWCNASDDVAGIRLPLNKGIVGHTVTTGEILNITDAYKDLRFNPSVDKKTNYVTKTILCVPIKYNNRIIGALECINKTPEGEYFSEADVILLNKMAQETAPSLQNKFMESALRIISQGLQDSSSRDYLSQFMHNEDNNNHTCRRRVLSIQNYKSSPKMYLKIRNDITRSDICTWDFNYFKLMEDNYQTAIPMMVYMFNDFGLLEKFNISEDKLYSFLIAVKKHYYDNPYHNFLHAFSVMHVTYLILKQTTMIKYFDILDILTVFISAICHDLEHPGLTNAYQVNSGSDLAMRYNDKSVLENHHAHIGAVLLKQPELSILSELTNDEKNKVRKSMINIILHTDMSYHQDIVTEMLRFNNKDKGCDMKENNDINDSDKQFLSGALVHLGDLSNPVMRWDQSHEWSLRVIDEFVAQSQLEKEQKLKESMAFITDKSPESVSKVQTSFIDYVVKPLWKNAKAIAGELDDRLNVLDKNRENWSNYPHNYQKLRQKNFEN